MRWFGLTPDRVLARGPAAGIRPPPAPEFAIAYGALSFAGVSVLAYSIWAYRLLPEGAVLYAATAAVYLGLSGLALSRLVAAPRAALRFALLFALLFLLYAVVWSAVWFGLEGKFHAAVWGSALGLAALTWGMQRAFGVAGGFLPAWGVLFACHTLGFDFGDVLYRALGGTAGRLLWGVAHGLGFGAGLGYVLRECQAPLVARAPARPAAASPAPMP